MVKDAACAACGAPIHPKRNKTGYCIKHVLIHNKALPGFEERRQERFREATATAEYRELCSEGLRRRWADPEKRRQQSETAKKNYHLMAGSPQCRAANLAPEARAKRAETLSRYRLAKIGVPHECREQYLHLRRVKGLSVEEARGIVLADMLAKAMRQTRPKACKLSPFERQERALENGASLTEAITIKTLDGTRRAG